MGSWTNTGGRAIPSIGLRRSQQVACLFKASHSHLRCYHLRHKSLSADLGSSIPEYKLCNQRVNLAIHGWITIMPTPCDGTILPSPCDGAIMPTSCDGTIMPTPCACLHSRLPVLSSREAAMSSRIGVSRMFNIMDAV